MQCPRCRNALERKSKGDSPVWRCPGCRGMWIRLDSLDSLAAEIAPSAAGVLEFLRMNGRMLKPSKACPSCGLKLSRKSYPSINGIALDFCWPCGSAWFDRGELRKVSESGRPAEEAPPKKPAARPLRMITQMKKKRHMLSSRTYLSNWDRAELDELNSFLLSYERARRRADARKHNRPEAGQGEA